MIYKLRVHPNAKEEKIESVDGVLYIYVEERAEKNKANIAVVKLLCRYVKNPQIEVLSTFGFLITSKIKFALLQIGVMGSCKFNFLSFKVGHEKIKLKGLTSREKFVEVDNGYKI